MAVSTNKSTSISRCVYCLKETKKPLSDNIFSQTWQGESSLEKQTRWQVPACMECVNKFDLIEHDFLIRIGSLFSPVEVYMLGIAKEAIEFIEAKTQDSRKGISEKSTPNEILFRQIVRGARIDPKLIEKVKKAGKYSSILDIKRLTAKIIRGLVYVVNDSHIEKNHTLEIFFAHELEPKPVREAIESLNSETICGKGVKIIAAFAEDDPQSGIFEIRFWEKLTLFAFVK